MISLIIKHKEINPQSQVISINFRLTVKYVDFCFFVFWNPVEVNGGVEIEVFRILCLVWLLLIQQKMEQTPCPTWVGRTSSHITLVAKEAVEMMQAEAEGVGLVEAVEETTRTQI